MNGRNQLLDRRATRRVAYSLAAGAASAAVAPHADAEIQYFTGPIDIPAGLKQPLDFNIGQDDYDDIVLKNYNFTNGKYQGATVGFYPGKIVGFVAGPLGNAYATALTAGTMIDESNVGPSFVGSLAYGSRNPNAQFNNVTDAYIGFAFPIGPTDVYNAWIRVSINNAAGTFTIHDWAYEDQLGVGIAAGDTGSTGVLGDFDEDGDVDGADFLDWQRRLGGPSGSGGLTAADLELWKSNFGSQSGAAATAAVPEPGALGLLAAGGAGLAWLRRRHGAAPT